MNSLLKGQSVNNKLFAMVPPTLMPVYPLATGATIWTMNSLEAGVVSGGSTKPTVTSNSGS